MNASPLLRHRRAIYWLFQLVGWSGYFILCTIASRSFAPVTSRTLVFYLCLSACGLLLTHGFRAFVRRNHWVELPLRRLIPSLLGATLLLAVVLVAAGFLFSAVVSPTGMHREGTASLVSATVFFVFNDFVILSFWSVIYFGVAWFEREQRIEVERYRARTALAEAELRGLKTQLNPHFLFNALNTVRALVLEDPPRAQNAVTQLAALLRYHLTSGERSLVRLEEELATVEQYLALELIRFEDRLQSSIEIEPAAKSCLIPPLAVQTLVENAIKYGVSRQPDAARLTLNAQLHEDQLVVRIGNTGMLKPNGSDESTHLGLTNLQTRLAILFPDRSSLTLTQAAADWVEAQLILPATKEST